MELFAVGHAQLPPIKSVLIGPWLLMSVLPSGSSDTIMKSVNDVADPLSAANQLCASAHFGAEKFLGAGIGTMFVTFFVKHIRKLYACTLTSAPPTGATGPRKIWGTVSPPDVPYITARWNWWLSPPYCSEGNRRKTTGGGASDTTRPLRHKHLHTQARRRRHRDRQTQTETDVVGNEHPAVGGFVVHAGGFPANGEGRAGGGKQVTFV